MKNDPNTHVRVSKESRDALSDFCDRIGIGNQKFMDTLIEEFLKAAKTPTPAPLPLLQKCRIMLGYLADDSASVRAELDAVKEDIAKLKALAEKASLPKTTKK